MKSTIKFSLNKAVVLDLYTRGAISLGRAAEILNLTPHDVLRIAQQKGIRTGASPEQMATSGETLHRLTQETKA